MRDWIATPEPGIYPADKVPAELYHRWDAMSASWLGRLADSSPKQLQYDRRHPPEPTEAMQFGSMLHKLVAEPFDFNKEFAIAPDVNRVTKAGKAEWAAFVKRSAGLAVVRRSGRNSYEMARVMAHAIKGNPAADKLLTGAQTELSIVWDDKDTGIRLKSRLDAWQPPFVVDLKSAVSAKPETFARATRAWNYDLQYALYTDGARIVFERDDIQFLFAVVEKHPPYDCVVMPDNDTDAESIYRLGKAAYRTALRTYKQCVDSGEWPGYGGTDGTAELPIPEWLLRAEGVLA